MKKKLTTTGYFLLVVFLVDRITKNLAMLLARMPQCILSGFTCVYVKNRGISWGMLYASNVTMFIMTTIFVATVIAALAVYTYRRWLQNRSILGECLVLTGAVSNFIDRILYSGVIDFIELSYNGYYFPVFNIADVAIVMGVGIMLLTLWRES
jgi:signal peptidase II